MFPGITYSDIEGWQSYLASFNGDLDDFAVGGLISGDDDKVDGLTEVISLSNSGSFHFLTVDEAPGNYEGKSETFCITRLLSTLALISLEQDVIKSKLYRKV